TFTTYELDIAVEWRGTCWDLLRSFDAASERVPGGYVCGLYPEANRPIFPSRDAVWRSGDIFEPFLEWVNGELADAVGVSIFGAPRSTPRAKLIKLLSFICGRKAPARSAVPDGSHRLAWVHRRA